MEYYTFMIRKQDYKTLFELELFGVRSIKKTDLHYYFHQASPCRSWGVERSVKHNYHQVYIGLNRSIWLDFKYCFNTRST